MIIYLDIYIYRGGGGGGRRKGRGGGGGSIVEMRYYGIMEVKKKFVKIFLEMLVFLVMGIIYFNMKIKSLEFIWDIVMMKLCEFMKSYLSI